jgi:hypothetical protein
MDFGSENAVSIIYGYLQRPVTSSWAAESWSASATPHPTKNSPSIVNVSLVGKRFHRSCCLIDKWHVLCFPNHCSLKVVRLRHLFLARKLLNGILIHTTL